MKYFAHQTADIAENVEIGENTKIWNNAQIREDVKVGNNCTISKNVYLDFGVKVGNNCKIQNNTSIYHGVTISDGVFVGPHVIFANDKLPRAINPDGGPKENDDWVVGKTQVKYGASIGAHSVILPDVTIGTYAMIGAGSVVTKNVPDYTLVYGNPAREHGHVCSCGESIYFKDDTATCKCEKKYKMQNNLVTPL